MTPPLYSPRLPIRPGVPPDLICLGQKHAESAPRARSVSGPAEENGGVAVETRLLDEHTFDSHEWGRYYPAGRSATGSPTETITNRHPEGMHVDRTPGGHLDSVIKISIRRAHNSADTAKKLLGAQLPGPAYVWAVRSIEIFVKEVMLLPVYLESSDGDWQNSWTKVRQLFDSGKWDRALREVENTYGRLTPMLTEDGKDVWQVWKSVVVGYRGDIVHGRAEPSQEDARVVVAWVEQMMLQLTMRLIADTTHPMHDLFVAGLDAARSQMEQEGSLE